MNDSDTVDTVEEELDERIRRDNLDNGPVAQWSRGLPVSAIGDGDILNKPKFGCKPERNTFDYKWS